MSEYKGFRIKEIHAILAIGDDDEEAVPAFMVGSTWMPLIAADPTRLDAIKDMGQQMADVTGKNFKIVRFSAREDIGEIKSKKRKRGKQ
jgi:hypothetical protein